MYLNVLMYSAAKFFFDRLVNYMASGEMEALVLAHSHAIEKWRELMGPTRPSHARSLAPHSIRAQHGLTDTRNSVHGSGLLTYYINCVCAVAFKILTW